MCKDKSVIKGWKKYILVPAFLKFILHFKYSISHLKKKKSRRCLAPWFLYHIHKADGQWDKPSECNKMNTYKLGLLNSN